MPVSTPIGVTTISSPVVGSIVANVRPEADALRWLTGSEAVRVYADYRTYGTPPPAGLSAMVQIAMADGYGEVRLGDADGWRVAARQDAFDFLGDYLDPRRLAGFAAQVDDFALAIREGLEPVVTGLDGRAAVEMVEAADRSAASGQAVILGS